MKHRVAIALSAAFIAAAALAGCGNDDNPGLEPPSSTTETAPQVIDPFEGSSTADRQRVAVDRIIEIGSERGESANAIVAALTASRAEARWWIALDGTSYDLFGWNPRFGNKPRNNPATVDAAIHNFYDLGKASGLDPEKNGPVDYAVRIQTTDVRVVDKSGDQRDYYQDRTSKDTWQDRSSRLGTEDKVRNEYTDVVPLAQAAYEQFGSNQ